MTKDAPAITASAGPRRSARGVRPWLVALLALAATFLLWSDPGALAYLTDQPLLLVGALASFVLWLMASANAVVHARLRRATEALAARERGAILGAPSIADVAPGAAAPVAGSRGVAAWLVLVLGLAVTALLWLDDEPIREWVANPLPIVGAIASTALAAMIAANAANRLRAHRLAAQLDAGRDAATLATDALQSMHALVSAVTPDAARSRFNRRFCALTGRSEEALAGHGWLDLVRTEDRVALTAAIAKGPPARGPIEVEYRLTGAGGEHRWIRESFAPRRGPDGAVIEYVASAIDVTAQVENDVEYERTIERLRGDIARLECARDEAAAAHRKEAAELTKSRDHLLRTVEAAARKAQESAEKLTLARSEMSQAKSDLKAAEVERQQMRSEKRQLEQSLEKLQVLADRAESRQQTLARDLERVEAQLERAKADAVEARQGESAHRAKAHSLTTRCDDLEAKLDSALASHAGAEEAAAQREAAEADGALARERATAAGILPHAEQVAQLVEHLSTAALDDAQLSRLEEAQAAAAVLRAFVGGPAAARSSPRTRPFDLRSAVRNVCDLLAPMANARGVELRSVVHPDFPPQVVGAPVALREAVMLLVRAAIDASPQGVLSVKIAADGATVTHVSARVDVRHETARVVADRVNALFALSPAAPSGAETGAPPVAAAWAIIGAMGGTFGATTPKEGGFAVWFSVTLPKHDAPTAPAPIREAPGHATPAETAPPRAPRLPQELLECSLGEVRELGADSIRVRSLKLPKGRVTITLPHPAGDLAVEAEVESAQKLASRKHDVVLNFVGLDPGRRALVLQVAMTHRLRSMLPINSIAVDRE